MNANEGRTHGNNHLISCLTCSSGRRCARDLCVSNSEIEFYVGVNAHTYYFVYCVRCNKVAFHSFNPGRPYRPAH